MRYIFIVIIGILSLILCGCAEFWKEFISDPSKYKDKEPNPWMADEYFNGELTPRLHYECTGAYVGVDNGVLVPYNYFQLSKDGICYYYGAIIAKWFSREDTLFIERQQRYSQTNELLLFKINTSDSVTFIGRKGGLNSAIVEKSYIYLDFGNPLLFRLQRD